ncbi:translation initiation factor [Psychrosphaera sp.]|nr:translation initiation factor [Psychrosphaera sp.]
MSDWQNQLGNLVYSTETGKIDEPVQKPEKIGEAYSDGFLRIQRQTKGRKGKGVSIITGLELPPEEFKKLAQNVKKKCGKGGAIKEGTIEIQGDDREQIKAVLESLGYKCKLAGG